VPHRALIAFAIALALASASALVAGPRPAHAEGLYYVSGSEGSLEATATRLYGVSAESWVQFDPHEIYSLHLNSVYVWLDEKDYVEAGWAWYTGDIPMAYVAYERKGFTSDQQRVWLGPVQPGTWVHLEVANTGLSDGGPVRWECRVGTATAAVYEDFGRATLRVSSERQTYRDSDYGLFEDLRRLDAGGTWSRWRELRVQTGDQDYGGFAAANGGFEVR
jgi:hypothetical protein